MPPGLTSSTYGTQASSSNTYTLPTISSNALDIIVIGVAIPISSGTNYILSMADSAGNTYTRRSASAVTGFDGEVWTAQSPSASSGNSVTVTLLNAATGWSVVAGSYSGVELVQAVGTPWLYAGNTVVTSVTPVMGGAFVIAHVLTDSAVTYTPSSTTVGYNDIPGTGTSSQVHQAYNFDGVASPDTFTVTLSSSQTLVAVSIALAPVQSGPVASYITQVAIAPGSSGTTPGITLNDGDSVYMFVSYACAAGATAVSTVKDSAGNSYTFGGKIQNTGSTPAYPAQEIWYLDYPTAPAGLTVTVTMSASCEFIATAVVVRGANGLGSFESVSSGSTGTGPASSDPINTLSQNALIISCLCAQRGGTYFTSPGGFLGAYGGTVGSPTTGLNANLWVVNGPRIGTYNSKLTAAVAEPYAILTVSIRATPTYGFIPGASAVTVGALGLANGGSLLPNNGSQFGPDTPGTTTCGIQEALNAAFATGTLTVQLESGLFPVSSQILWPGGWSGILAGSGATEATEAVPGTQMNGSHVQGQSGLSAASLLKLDDSVQNTQGATMADIYWDGGAATLSLTVVDFTQFSEASVKTQMRRCTFDAGSSGAPHSLVMDSNDDSILFHCTCLNTNKPVVLMVTLASSLRWESPLGGNKIIGGIYDGMSLAFQNSTQIFVTNNTAWRVLASSAPNPRLNLYGCYKNANSDPTTTTSAPIVQNDNGALFLSIEGGYFYIDIHMNNKNDPFFASTSSSCPITLTARNCYFITKAGSGTNNLFGTSTGMGTAPSSLADFDPNSASLVNQGSATVIINSQPLGSGGQGTGYGIAHLVADNRLTGLSTAAAGATYMPPTQDSDLEVSAYVYVTTLNGLKTQVLVTYTPESSLSSISVSIPVLAAGATSFSTGSQPIAAAGAFVGATLRIRAKAGQPVTVQTDPSGTYPTSPPPSYNFDSSIKLISTS
jgi:hypothetical protein